LRYDSMIISIVLTKEGKERVPRYSTIARVLAEELKTWSGVNGTKVTTRWLH
jgi:hypothetical protein